MKYICIGVSNQSKAYELYDPKTKKIIISRDVMFDEQNFWTENRKVIELQMLEDFYEVEESAQKHHAESGV